MKSLKPFLLVLAGVLITVAIFSFKSEEPKKEYCRITYGGLGKIRVYYGNNSIKEVSSKPITFDNDVITLVNDMAKEGWNISNTEGFIIYLERTKQ